MYKRIEKRIKDQEYERDMQEVLDILNDRREKHLQSINKLDVPDQNDTEQRETQYTEKTIQTHTCRLCKSSFKGSQVAIHRHVESEEHKENLRAYKKRFRLFIAATRLMIFKSGIMMPTRRLLRLRFFKKVYQFE